MFVFLNPVREPKIKQLFLEASAKGADGLIAILRDHYIEGVLQRYSLHSLVAYAGELCKMSFLDHRDDSQAPSLG